MKPLAERMRPQTIDEIIGQEHLLAQDAPLRKMIEQNTLSSIILWGPPGTGKTTLAKAIAHHTKREFYSINAIESGVKQIKEVAEKVSKANIFATNSPILFIDEIHRFNKAQQDSLLKMVEEGLVVLIAATTENPSFQIINPLLSRCNVYTLKELSKENLIQIANQAIKTDTILKNIDIKIVETDALLYFSGGDARKLLNIIELTINYKQNETPIIIDNKIIEKVVQHKFAYYDKTGDLHYDIISAFIKSVRGSDPDASLYWLARMLNAGEDILFIARRLIILAAEDIGLANPNALLLANATYEVVSKIGMPEARIILSETTIYLASSPKSNSAYKAINAAIDFAKQTSNAPVPKHLRNAPTKLMKDLGYSAGYKYPHNYPEHFTDQSYFPDNIQQTFYYPADNPRENSIKNFLKKLWKRKN